MTEGPAEGKSREGHSRPGRTARLFIRMQGVQKIEGRNIGLSLLSCKPSTSVTEQVGQMMHIMFAPLENCENLRVTCCQTETKKRMNNSNSERGKEGKRQAPTVMMVMALVYVASFLEGQIQLQLKLQGAIAIFRHCSFPVLAATSAVHRPAAPFASGTFRGGAEQDLALFLSTSSIKTTISFTLTASTLTPTLV